METESLPPDPSRALVNLPGPKKALRNYWLIEPLRRFMAISLMVWPMLGVYMVINHHQFGTPVAVVMPSWVPFSPGFFAPYMAMLLMTWLLPVAIRDASRFRACLWANICAWLLVMPWWILTPTTLLRPPLPEGSWADSFQFLWAIDESCNVMPCAHGIGPVVAAWFAGRDHPMWRWPLAGMLALGLPSIALVWQHRPIDILLGTVAAAIGIAFGEMMSRRRRSQVQKSG